MLITEQGPYILMVKPDDFTINPRELDEHFGKMVCFHRRYELGDRHDYLDKDDFLRQMYLDTVGDDERGALRYERMIDKVWSQKMTGPTPNEGAVDEAILREISRKYIMLPLYLYDHSGLTINTTGFACPWDNGQVGWIYASKADALQELGGEKMTAALRQKTEELMRSEVAVYDSYLRGECYGFELYKNGELADSCWGFLGDMEEACKAIADRLPDECKGMIKQLEDQTRPASIIQTLLRHAKIQVEQTDKAIEHSPRPQGPEASR